MTSSTEQAAHGPPGLSGCPQHQPAAQQPPPQLQLCLLAFIKHFFSTQNQARSPKKTFSSLLTAGIALLAQDLPVASVREDADERLRRVAHHVLCRAGVSAGLILAPTPVPTSCQAPHLLLQGHDGVHAEIAALTGIRDPH